MENQSDSTNPGILTGKKPEVAYKNSFIDYSLTNHLVATKNVAKNSVNNSKAKETIQKDLIKHTKIQRKFLKKFSLFNSREGLTNRFNQLVQFNEFEFIELPLLILNLDEFKNFNYSSIFYHQNGSGKAFELLTEYQSHQHNNIELGLFNKLHNYFNKKKSTTFQKNELFKKNLKFNGHFMAKSFTYKYFRIVIVISENSFLPPTELVTSSFKLILPIYGQSINNILIGEMIDKKSALFKKVFQFFPIPIRMTSKNNELTLSNLSRFPQPLTLREQSHNFNNNYLLEVFEQNKISIDGDLYHFQRINILGELLNTLKHELSNPLFGLKLSVEILLSETKDEETTQGLKDILLSTMRCGQIIKNFAGLYEEKEKFIKVKVNELLHDTLSLTKSETKQIRKIIKYKQQYLEKTELTTNPTWLSQILFNLIINSAQALNATELERKSITIVVDKNENMNKIIFKIYDNGPGITDNDAPNLFNPFYTTKDNGTGLGLTICRNLSHKLSGHLYFEKNDHCPGSCFVLELPL